MPTTFPAFLPSFLSSPRSALLSILSFHDSHLNLKNEVAQKACRIEAQLIELFPFEMAGLLTAIALIRDVLLFWHIVSKQHFQGLTNKKLILCV